MEKLKISNYLVRMVIGDTFAVILYFILNALFSFNGTHCLFLAFLCGQISVMVTCWLKKAHGRNS